MTSQELRADPQFTARMAQILSDPAFAHALVTLREEGESEDADDRDPEIASVRILARQKGRASFLRDLVLLAEPLHAIEQPLVPTFGTGLSQEEAAEALAAG